MYPENENLIPKLLLQLTDLVFECRVCRRLFRSLPNYVRHKELECESKPRLEMKLRFSKLTYPQIYKKHYCKNFKPTKRSFLVLTFQIGSISLTLGPRLVSRVSLIGDFPLLKSNQFLLFLSLKFLSINQVKFL